MAGRCRRLRLYGGRRVRLYTALEFARIGWHGRARLHASRVALVDALERDHRTRYPDAQKAMCTEPGCRRPVRALGLCATDYKRWRRAA
jgi:hypothetical protein